MAAFGMAEQATCNLMSPGIGVEPEDDREMPEEMRVHLKTDFANNAARDARGQLVRIDRPRALAVRKEPARARRTEMRAVLRGADQSFSARQAGSRTRWGGQTWFFLPRKTAMRRRRRVGEG